VLQPYFTVSG